MKKNLPGCGLTKVEKHSSRERLKTSGNIPPFPIHLLVLVNRDYEVI
jgi:hypothetical protein